MKDTQELTKWAEGLLAKLGIGPEPIFIEPFTDGFLETMERAGISRSAVPRDLIKSIAISALRSYLLTAMSADPIMSSILTAQLVLEMDTIQGENKALVDAMDILNKGKES